MNRRDFVKRTGAAIVPVALLGPRLSAWIAANAASASALRMAEPITSVIYDGRYRDCRLFADTLVRQGAIAFPLNGNFGQWVGADSASVWYGHLRAHLTRHGGRVAGLMTYSDSGVSQSCGRELHLKTVYEGAHDCRCSENLSHRLRSGAEAHEIAAAFVGGNARWPQYLACGLCDFSRSDLRGVASLNDFACGGASNPVAWAEAFAKTSRSDDHPGYLTSWLLAPDVRST